MNKEEAIAVLENEIKCVDKDCNIERSCGNCPYAMPSKEPILEAYKMAIKALGQESSRSENPNKWIPVSERLPEENGSYFVTVKRGYVTIAIWVGTAEFWSEVTAWMPLPETYKVSPTEAEGSEE